MKKNNTAKLERYHLNELPSAWEKDLNRDSLQEDLKELEESDRAILEKYSPSDMAARIREKMDKSEKPVIAEIPFKKPARRIRSTYLIPAAAMILFGLLLPTMIIKNRVIENGQEITRIKGVDEPELRVYRKLGEKSEILKEFSTAAEADLLQLAYRVDAPLYGTILSIDGRGVVTRHFPEEEETALRLQTGGEQRLPFSYELDDAPGFETFYLITSETPFPIGSVIDLIVPAARKSGIVLDIPELIENSELKNRIDTEIRQYTVAVKKED